MEVMLLIPEGFLILPKTTSWMLIKGKTKDYEYIQT